MKQAFFVAFLALAAQVNGQVSLNASFIAGEIAQISACGVYSALIKNPRSSYTHNCF
jgi:hypothetical protein